MTDIAVWMEGNDGQRWPIVATCSIGRSTTNDLVVDDGLVSRRHALIHKQDDAEYWVIDLGSGNGTYLNGRRVTLATRLNDGDQLTFGPRIFTFRSGPTPARFQPSSPVSVQTIIQVKTLECWLLIVDIKGSTALAQTLPSTELAVLVGKWLAHCKEIIEGQKGAINKYLGDGFLAYWPAGPSSLTGATSAIRELVRMQQVGEGPPFRLAVHYGLVAIGGGGSAGEDSLSGPEVIRLFRMEKLAKSLGRDALFSEAARSVMHSNLGLADAGAHQLPNFDGPAARYFALE